MSPGKGRNLSDIPFLSGTLVEESPVKSISKNNKRHLSPGDNNSSVETDSTIHEEVKAMKTLNRVSTSLGAIQNRNESNDYHEEDRFLKIQTFRNTWEEFKDFNGYIEYMESVGAHRAGIVKIIPPPEYVVRKAGYDLDKISVLIEPSHQVVATLGKTAGSYQQVNIEANGMTFSEFKKIAESPGYAAPQIADIADLENFFWETVTEHAGIYGSDIHATLTDHSLKTWNLNNIGSILDNIGLLAGITDAYLYLGMWKTAFPWHTEDNDLYSINYLHFGAPKIWYAIPPSYGRKFEEECAKTFPKTASTCASFLRHKTTLLSPKWLQEHEIPFDTVVQEAGEIIITFPYGYHSGFNTGFNCAEATNFATKRWIEYGKHAAQCSGLPSEPGLDMEVFVKKYQSDEMYERWLLCKEDGVHPEHKGKTPWAEKRKKSFKERHPELDATKILENPRIDEEIKRSLRHILKNYRSRY